MDVNLDNLIEKIKKDGIDKAQKDAEEIVARARRQAEDIVGSAKKEAESIVEQAARQAEKEEKNGKNALKQAARDLSLKLRQEITGLFTAILKKSVTGELTPEFVKSLILKVVDGWKDKEGAGLEVLVSDKDRELLKNMLVSEFNKRAQGTIEVKPSKALDKGFRIGLKGDDVHYDFSEESILEALKTFLNPAIAALLDSRNG